MSLLFILQIIYWLSLSTWFGGVLFVAISAQVIFRVVRESKPILPSVLSVNLENQHADLLAGSIVGSVLSVLSRIEMACAGGVALGLLGQWMNATQHGSEPMAQIGLRSTLCLLAAGLVVYDRLAIWPQITRYKDEYVDHADEPDIANPAKDQFDRFHHQSVNVLTVVLLLLLGLVLFSGNIPNGTITISSR
jgi:hypothetical protein